MKIKLLSVIGAVLMITGCKTTDQTAFTATVIHLVARRGTFEAVKYKPEYRNDFIAAKAALDAILALGSPTPDQLVAALQSIKVKELQGDSGALAIADIKDLITLLTSKFSNVDVSGLKQIIAALDAGISEGLGLPAPPSALLRLHETASTGFRPLLYVSRN